MASFNELAEVAQSISQTQSRLQIVQEVGDFLARLQPAEAEIAARFLIGRPFAQGDGSRLNLSGRAVWKIASEMVAAQDRGEDLFADAVDFGGGVVGSRLNLVPRPHPNLPARYSHCASNKLTRPLVPATRFKMTAITGRE